MPFSDLRFETVYLPHLSHSKKKNLSLLSLFFLSIISPWQSFTLQIWETPKSLQCFSKWQSLQWAVPLAFVACALIDTTYHPSGGISVGSCAAGHLPGFACFCSTCLSELRHFGLFVIDHNLTGTQLTLRSGDQSYRVDTVTTQFIPKFIKHWYWILNYHRSRSFPYLSCLNSASTASLVD